ncbi:hypothetical protein BJV78DRAFT_1385771 [Lactifluus subvellereus]|nr:hypothetical protein BJV78DRAFT_1385771 [Lactifluus subvellereus]
MFNIPQPTSENLHDGLPFVTLSEDSKTLDLALRHLYPVRSPTRVELGDARILAEFARKYQIDALESVILRSLTNSIEDDPVGVYAITATYRDKTIGRTAARSTLKLPIVRLQSLHLQFTTTELYGELVQYHTACGAAASAVASERTWFSSWELLCKFLSTARQSPTLKCRVCATQDLIAGLPNQTSGSSSVLSSSPKLPTHFSAIETRYGPRYLWSYLHRSSLVPAQQPAAEAITTIEFVLKSFDCAYCPSGTLRDLVEFSRVFRAETKNALERVSVSILATVPCWHCSKRHAHISRVPLPNCLQS